MHIAIEDIGLNHLWIIYPGDQKYALDSKITVVPLEEIAQLAEPDSWLELPLIKSFVALVAPVGHIDLII